MAKAVSVARLLCALVFCSQALSAQPADISFPPEDMDSSGDDYDSFSGSGAGHPATFVKVSLQGRTNMSSLPESSTDSEYKQPEVQQTDSPTEYYPGGPVSQTSMPLVPLMDLVTDKTEVATEYELDSFTEQGTTRSPVITTRIPATHHISTVRTTTSQISSTHFIEAEVYQDVHQASSTDDATPALDFVPTSERSLDTASPTTISSGDQNEIPSLPDDGGILIEDGSGSKDDFSIDLRGENSVLGVGSVDTETKNAKSAGTAQGIMDRKEVLGGVIAGGLVGLLFAGFLVGFMLYRMKKKDEGSYSLDEPKQSNGGYQKPQKQEEFYA
uniref:Syndecan n=1 Tax=Podarcis muralis TaxID=64176 RepID=A0A670HV66_PODMU|nr:syndecan-1 [Podarcis muralis]